MMVLRDWHWAFHLINGLRMCACSATSGAEGALWRGSRGGRGFDTGVALRLRYWRGCGPGLGVAGAGRRQPWAAAADQKPVAAAAAAAADATVVATHHQTAPQRWVQNTRSARLPQACILINWFAVSFCMCRQNFFPFLRTRKHFSLFLPQPASNLHRPPRRSLSHGLMRAGRFLCERELHEFFALALLLFCHFFLNLTSLCGCI
jgi:hypothetical protein